MSTEAQLKALSNSELASGIQIPALNHRTVNNAIIEEMYDAQSRGNVLSGVQSAGSLASGDQVFVIRSGQAYLLDASNLDFVSALSDLTDVSITSLSNDQILVYDTSVSRWVNKFIDEIIIGGTITGDGTAGKIAKFTDLKEIGDSSITDDGTTVTVSAALSVSSFATLSDKLRTPQIEGFSASAQNQKIFFTDDSIILQVGENPNLTIGAGGQFNVATGADFNGTVQAGSFVTDGGTSSDFVKGNGTLDSTTYQDTSEKGQANGYAPLDSGAKVAEAYLPDSILGQVSYQGTWDASTNTPTLANPPASTTKGEYYVTSVAGTQFSIDFQVGDWIISNGTSWEKVDNTDAVTSVFGRLGNIVANESDYASFYVDFDSDQSITGQKTFGSGDLRIVSGGSGNLPTIFINSSVGSSTESGFNSLGFNGSNDFYFTKGVGASFNGAIFSYDNSAIRTYTLQDSSGTLAFTSDINDTLDSVTDRGNTTTNSITVGAATINGNLTVDTNTLFVDSANNRVGIGTSSPAAKLEALGNIISTFNSTSNGGETSHGLVLRQSTTSTKALVSGYSTSGNQTGAYIQAVNFGTAYEDLAIQPQGGNVGIGGSPTNSYKLELLGSSEAANTLGMTYIGVGAAAIKVNSSGDLEFGLDASDGSTERMRIDSSGNVLVGTTSFVGTGAAGISAGNSISLGGSNPWSWFVGNSDNGSYVQYIQSIGTSTHELVAFIVGNPTSSMVGSITSNGSSTSYNTTSDYRLKENVVEMTGALDRVDALKPSRFNFINDAKKTVDGFLAHEVQDIVPEAVTGEKDAVDEEGNPIYQGIDQSKLVPLLVGAVKDLKAIVQLQQAEIEALKAAMK